MRTIVVGNSRISFRVPTGSALYIEAAPNADNLIVLSPGEWGDNYWNLVIDQQSLLVLAS